MKAKYLIEQKNKYLEKIGLKPHQYGINFMLKNSKGLKKYKRKWKEEKRKYGFDARETWVMNSMSVELLYCHCKMYLKEAGKVINLSYHTCEFDRKQYTQKQAVKQIMEWCKFFLLHGEEDEFAMEAYRNAQDAFRL